MRIELGKNYNKFNKLVGKEYTTVKDGINYLGIVRNEHPNFDISLIRNEHYYGSVTYWLDVNEKLV